MVGNHVEELELGGRVFRFELCRRAERMGPVSVDHWWMDTRRVYGQRGRTATVRDAVTGYFADARNRDLIERLRAAGLNFSEPRTVVSGGVLEGQAIVLTGTLPTLSRSGATALIEAAGGKVAGTVSKKTSFVVAGDDAGSKLDKAKQLGIAVIDEADLLRRLGRTP